MPYIGNELATQFQAFVTQTITGDGSTGYTLDRAVANGKELLVYINNVKQEEGSGKSYTATGTTITFSAAVASTDSCYVVFLGSAIQTIKPPDASVGSAQITNATLVMPNKIDMNGNELILDADADTSITADTDDRIDIKIAGSDVAGFDASGNFHLGNGTATNDGAIHINAGASAKNIVLEADRASDGQGLGNIQWHSAGTNVAQLSAERAASDSSADMVFYTYENSGSLTERARIDDKGDMFIGLSLDMGGKLNVHADGVAVGEGTSANEYRRMYWHASNNQLQFWNGTNECVINSSGAFTDASDKKLKKDIADITYGIDIVKALKPRKYKMKDTNEEQVGFIAQEVEPHIPEVVTTGTNPDGVEQKSLAYQHLTAVLTKALQEAVAKIETLETKVAALEGG